MSAVYHRSLRGRLNEQRYLLVMDLVDLQPTDRVLDLGCGRGKKSVAYYNRTNPIVGVDRHPPASVRALGDNFEYVEGDARYLPMFPDGSFDVVLSFGLLEHVVDDADVRAIIAEAARLADRFAHVVPHPLAFIEPHTRMPLFGRWPAPVRSLYLRFGGRHRPSEYWRDLRWRSTKEWRALFGDSDARVVRHWYGPLLMDYIIYGGRLDKGGRRETSA